MTHHFALLAILVASACTAVSEPGPAEPVSARKVYDFSGIRLADPPPVAATGSMSPKRMIRDAVIALRPQLLACTAADPAAGTLGVVFELAGSPDRPTAIDAIRFDGDLADHATLAACFRDAFSGMAMAPMPEDAVWEVHFPITIGR